MQSNRLILTLILFTFVCLYQTQPAYSQRKTDKEKYNEQQLWVEQQLKAMTVEQKIGQLFMIPAYAKQGREGILEVEQLVGEYHIGGIVFHGGDAATQVKLTNHYQSLSKVPLLIGMNAERGAGQVLKQFDPMPKQLTVGAINSNLYVYNMGKQIAEQCHQLGVHINFAPVVDINSNPSNPVLGERSFGEVRDLVTAKGSAYMRGMQDNGVLACAKHFPGGGDVKLGKEIPLLKRDMEELEKMELYPFKNLIVDSVKSIMVGHLKAPALEDQSLPISVSRRALHDILRDSLNFDGLIISDAIALDNFAQYHQAGKAEAEAIIAGNDIILHPLSIPKAVRTLKNALASGKLTEEELNKKVERVLRAKYFAGLSDYQRTPVTNVLTDLNPSHLQAFKQELFEQAITVVTNKKSLLPLKNVSRKNVALVNIGGGDNIDTFAEYVDKYADYEYFPINGRVSTASMNRLVKRLKGKDTVIVGVFADSGKLKSRFGVSYATAQFIKQLQKQSEVITVLFGSPYGLKYLEGAEHLICAYENDTIAQKVAPQVIFGALDTFGKLPISASRKFPVGTGINLKSIKRVSYGLPESVGMDSKHLVKIDSIVADAIQHEAMPGCQVLAIKDGKIVYEKSFGHYTYNKQQKVNNGTIYDLASITKVASTVQSLMYLSSQNAFDINKTLGYYLPSLDTTNKKNLKVRHVLTHCSALRGGYFFWGHVMDKDTRVHYDDYLSVSKKDGFGVQVSPSLYVQDSIKEDMWKWLINAGLSTRRRYSKGRYRYYYSDLGYYYFQRIVEQKSMERLDEFTANTFYKPLGLKTMGYLPLERFSEGRITPTEMDVNYRKELIRGHVHDPSAALMGGVAGHAGLFSNAHDLGILMQMNLQEGYYGGKEYFSPDVVKTYTSRPYAIYKNRRGYGWDKSNPWDRKKASLSPKASLKSYGHTGFTGTCAWVDPENDLVYVFLSNRVYPYANNKQLMRMEIREKIHTVFYEAIGNTPEQ